MSTIEQTLERLSRSKFRSGIRLTKAEKAYLKEKGPERIRSHAVDFVKMKLAPAAPLNDGKQTPMHGHPVFKAMHATACCCRGCLNKWYKVPVGRELTEEEQRRIVNLLMAWIGRNESNQIRQESNHSPESSLSSSSISGEKGTEAGRQA